MRTDMNKDIKQHTAPASDCNDWLPNRDGGEPGKKDTNETENYK